MKFPSLTLQGNLRTVRSWVLPDATDSMISSTDEGTMNKSESKVYKQLLLALRGRLRGDVNAMADAALNKTRSEASGDLSSMPIHMADVGTDNFEQEFTLSLMESEEETLGQIEAALERIEDSTYGICTECQGKIPKARLQALPYTAHCVKCAQRVQSQGRM